MKKLVFAAALSAAFGLGGIAVAQTTTELSANNAAPQIATSTAAVPSPHVRQVPPPDSRLCIRDTGSHIPPPKGGCLPVSGTSYSHEDLQRTGDPDIGRALQQLDPSITVSGH